MDRLGQITVPTLVMAGRDDFVFPPECQRALAAGLPHARLQIIDRAGHSPHSEQTAHVMTAIRHFLSADTPAAALIAGTGAATVALAHHAFPVSAPAAGAAATAGVGAAITNGAGGPQVSHPVATTGGSGVAVTTQTQTVNGQTVVTQVPRAAYQGS